MDINAVFNKLLFSVYNYRKDESCAKFNPLFYSLRDILASFLFEATVSKVLGPIVTHCNVTSLKTRIKVLKTKQKNPNYHTPKTVQIFNNVQNK